MNWILIVSCLLCLDITTAQVLSSSRTTNFFGTTRSRASNILRFGGDAYVHYDFGDYVNIQPEMFYQSRNESFSFRFITENANGLLWLDNGLNRVMYLAMKDGYLTFVIEFRDRAPVQILLRHQSLNDLNNFRWHTFRVHRYDRQLSFYVDNILIREITLDFDIQFVVSGDVYLGGSPDNRELTDGFIITGYDGALTEVFYEKWTSATRVVYISLLTYIGATHGNVTIIEPGRPTRPPPTRPPPTRPPPTRPPPTRPPPTRPPPTRSPVTVITVMTVISITQKGYNIHIPGHLDLRSGGAIKFRFRTLEYRGLLLYSQRAISNAHFMACEIFDGKLYFVYDFGSGAKRVKLSDLLINTGEWHEVKLEFTDRELIFYLNGQAHRIALTSQERLAMYLDDGIYIGGVHETVDLSWHIWNRRDEFVGCFGDLQLIGIGTNIGSVSRSQFNTVGIQNGCVTMAKQCLTTPCVNGACFDGLADYRCYCAGTGFSGTRCDQAAFIGGFIGNQYVTYFYSTRQITHTNDISIRFRSPLSRAFLFQTLTDHNDGFIRAELVDGRVKVTIRIDGQTQEFFTGSNLNINQWHTLHLRRRANQLELWVDSDRPKRHEIRGENFYIYIDRINLGSVSETGATVDGIAQNYIGYLQNVYFEQSDLFAELKRFPDSQINIIWIENEGQYGNINYNPVTFLSHDAFAQLTTLRIGLTMRLTFRFKTNDLGGVLLYNSGRNGKFIAIELVDGFIRFAFNNGYKNSFTVLQTGSRLNDNQWHSFEVREIKERNSRHYEIRVDNVRQRVPIIGLGALDLTGPLFIGGLSANMFRDRAVTSVIQSQHGFLGCMASMDLNGATPTLQVFANKAELIQTGCVDIQGVCSSPSPCFNGGVCSPGLTTFQCDCTLTGWAGLLCNEYPNGLYFNKLTNNIGILKYQFENLADFSQDNIALAFMTYAEDGMLMRLDSGTSSEFIEIYLEGGYIVARYNTGSAVRKIVLDRRQYNDGKYHILKFVRTGKSGVLIVDGYEITRQHEVIDSMLNKVQYVYIGGFQDSSGSISNAFNGIIGGTYWNQYGFVDLAYKADSFVVWQGGVDFIGRDWILIPPVVPTVPVPTPLPPSGGGPLIPPVVPTVPVPTPLPPSGGGPIVVSPDIGGAGQVNPGGLGGTGGGAVGGAPDRVGIGSTGGLSGGSGGIVGPGGIGGGPEAAGLVGGGGPAVPAAGATGARAGAVAGTILGTGAFLASLMWALWKFKPGTGGLGAAHPPAAAQTTPMTISQPTPATGAGTGTGAGAGGTKITVLNGSAGAGGDVVEGGGGGGGGGGGLSSGYTSYYSSSSATQSGGTAGGGVGGGGAGYDSATLRATGTFSNKGTSIGTPTATRAFLGSGGTATSYYSEQKSSYGTSGRGGGIQSQEGDYDMADGIVATTGGVGSGGGGVGGGMAGTTSKGYSSTMTSSYSYQVQNARTVKQNRDSVHQMVSYGGVSGSGAVTPGAAGDEVRVDCCLMGADGRSVVTGSTLGPPQVWDMQTGELLRIMKGDTVGSTNLHLASNDRLLVGAVHADLEINEYSTRKGVTNKKLQIWDFTTGRPLDMGAEESCSALCTMSNPEKIVFGRSEKYGNGTSIIIWDLLGNQPIKEMFYDAPVGNNDYINFLKLSQNDRYCVAGFTNSFDSFAEFVIFDMSSTSYNIIEPNTLRLDANTDCTVILPRDEAVTGLRNGDLVVWSLRTGQPSRQLLSSAGGHAHSKEVKAVALSEDSKYLVSASADKTLKVWDMQSERQINTLIGHTDEVWCVTISPDNEIIVSGSKDGTIRLWRMKNGMEICAFNTGVDIFHATMSHDKGTIVALGDKFGARKLIMLQVVRTKIRRQISS